MSGPMAEGGPLPPINRDQLAQHERRLAESALPPPITSDCTLDHVEDYLDAMNGARRPGGTQAGATGAGEGDTG